MEEGEINQTGHPKTIHKSTKDVQDPQRSNNFNKSTVRNSRQPSLEENEENDISRVEGDEAIKQKVKNDRKDEKVILF